MPPPGGEKLLRLADLFHEPFHGVLDGHDHGAFFLIQPADLFVQDGLLLSLIEGLLVATRQSLTIVNRSLGISGSVIDTFA